MPAWCSEDFIIMTAISWRRLSNNVKSLPIAATTGVMDIVNRVEHSGFRVGGHHLRHPGLPIGCNLRTLPQSSFGHRASPGTVVFNDVTSLAQLRGEWGYKPAAVVLSLVVSHPRANLFTCDAGHKAVSADAGVPTCAVAGHPDLHST
jgi:hypothetical protein